MGLMEKGIGKGTEGRKGGERGREKEGRLCKMVGRKAAEGRSRGENEDI